ncbi:MAG: sigma-70 family RNA polymerase sigma factor [Anaerolineae bacterium]|nr:sigma-70 family RNA polymerase sigma factor [Anaerolineae bacterium]
MALTSTARKTSVFANQETTHFDDLFETYWPKVCATLYRLTGDWDDAQDLALEVFYRLHQRPPKDSSRVSSWLYRVATRIGFNALRARQRRWQYEAQAEQVRLEQEIPLDPSVQVEQQETQQRVRRALSEMRPRAAQLLILRHSGLSYAEIADALNVAPGSVGTLLARAESEFTHRFRALETTHPGGRT